VKYIHAAVSMKPSSGVVRQMADEAKAAAALGLSWQVYLSQGSDLGHTLARWPAPLKYALLRLRFYVQLARLVRQGHKIILRYSPGDPFLFIASFFLGPYITVHHTLEEAELAASPLPYARLQLLLERRLGRRVLDRARTIICATPEIARHESDRVRARPDRRVLIYPNGILYPTRFNEPADLRRERPEIIFAASYFFPWHGLEALLDSMANTDEDGLLHLVGTLPEALQLRAEADPRVRIHGQLGLSTLNQLVAQCWVGLSSFALSSKRMTEACTLKVRDYLFAGLPVYAGHSDSGLPEDFEYFRQGPASWSKIIEYSRAMRAAPRIAVALAAQPSIDKKVLLARLYRSLS